MELLWHRRRRYSRKIYQALDKHLLVFGAVTSRNIRIRIRNRFTATKDFTPTWLYFVAILGQHDSMS